MRENRQIFMNCYALWGHLPDSPLPGSAGGCEAYAVLQMKSYDQKHDWDDEPSTGEKMYAYVSNIHKRSSFPWMWATYVSEETATAKGADLEGLR